MLYKVILAVVCGLLYFSKEMRLEAIGFVFLNNMIWSFPIIMVFGPVVIDSNTSYLYCYAARICCSWCCCSYSHISSCSWLHTTYWWPGWAFQNWVEVSYCMNREPLAFSLFFLLRRLFLSGLSVLLLCITSISKFLYGGCFAGFPHW